MNKIILQGIAYDAKSSFLKGTALAPTAIRRHYRSASSNFYAENGMEISPEIFSDKGDSEPHMYFDIEDFTLSNLKKDLPVITLGGDHSISYPVIKAIHKVKGPFHILHIDAHSDLYDNFEGDRYSHACPFARIMEDELAMSLTQVGIRTLTTHQQEQADKYGVKIVSAADYEKGALDHLEYPLYISLDLDALDPAFAPGVSHHEPGGLTSRQVLEIIQAVQGPVIGADIVEYNPLRDINDVTAMLAAKFLKEISAVILRTNPQDA